MMVVIKPSQSIDIIRVKEMMEDDDFTLENYDSTADKNIIKLFKFRSETSPLIQL